MTIKWQQQAAENESFRNDAMPYTGILTMNI